MERDFVRRHDRVLCVVTTTSCFAPRGCDRVIEVGGRVPLSYNAAHPGGHAASSLRLYPLGLYPASVEARRARSRCVQVAKLCKRRGMMHVVNNAYGVQDRFICEQLSSAARKGVITASVQSTDKNFMVPVGGAVVADFMGQSGGEGDCNVRAIDCLPLSRHPCPLECFPLPLLSLGTRVLFCGLLSSFCTPGPFPPLFSS